jgi:uncharacterized protein YcbX
MAHALCLPGHLFGIAKGDGYAPAVRITLPDGKTVTSTQQDCNQVLSTALTRQVSLATMAQGRITGAPSSLPSSWTAKSEEYRPDLEGLVHRDTVTEFALPAGTFFDSATVHVVTTATLNRLRDWYPQGRFEVPRFRPNIVLESAEEELGMVEQTWIGLTLAMGDDVRLRITGSCGRCVMTTLAQGDLPKDGGILRTASQCAQGHVSVYAEVVQGGVVRRGDRVRLS